jgi:hypothetical protein
MTAPGDRKIGVKPHPTAGFTAPSSMDDRTRQQKKRRIGGEFRAVAATLKVFKGI